MFQCGVSYKPLQYGLGKQRTNYQKEREDQDTSFHRINCFTYYAKIGKFQWIPYSFNNSSITVYRKEQHNMRIAPMLGLLSGP
jgi:hypothetical protein